LRNTDRFIKIALNEVIAENRVKLQQSEIVLMPDRLSQNDDGTWGRADKEWQTFLVVHALCNKGVL
jgi:hypothetical protein